MLLLLACSTRPEAIRIAGESAAGNEAQAYVVNHGWHTGFVIPSRAIQSDLPALKSRFPGAPYLEFGWGDKGFYQAKEITSGLTLRAIFWPTESVVHVVAVPRQVEVYFSNSQVEKICLGSGEYMSLLRFIESSFHKDDTGGIIPLQRGLYGDSQFYQGEGDYYLMNTCNKWTAKGLQSAGMDISPTFRLSAGSVMHYLEQQRQVLELNSSELPGQNRVGPGCR